MGKPLFGIQRPGSKPDCLSQSEFVPCFKLMLLAWGSASYQVHQGQNLCEPPLSPEERGPVQVQRLQLSQQLRCDLPAV